MNFDTFNIVQTKNSTNSNKQNICLVRGENNTVYDASGRAYIDFSGGNGENILGYSHPLLTNAIKEQSNKLLFVGDGFYNELYDGLRHELVENTVFDKLFFESCRASTLAHTIKLINSFYMSKGQEKNILVVADSLTAMTFGSSYEKRSQTQNRILKFTPLNDFESFRKNLTEDIGAVIIETFQMENGLALTKHDFLLQAYAHSKSNGALLVMNEFVSGMGRTGQMFSYQFSGISPDMVLLSKGLGGGMPISAFLTRGELAYFIAKNTNSSLGFLPSLAATRVVLNELKSGCLERISNVGNYLKAKLFKLSKFEFVKEIRGSGLILGIDIAEKTSAADIAAEMAKQGILLSVSTLKNTLLLTPPYTITRQEIDTAIDIISTVFSKHL